MEFRLTYQGQLPSTQKDPVGDQTEPPARAQKKHEMRQAFHRQLRRLWDITPFLTAEDGKSSTIVARNKSEPGSNFPHDKTRLAAKHALYGFNFVPLVTEDIELYCGLDILFLRPDSPGSVLWAGDIDNRIKTLIDALRLPKANEQYVERTPDADEKPFFCLLEDDKLITKLSVETDQLLEFVEPQQNLSDVRLVITVRIWPYHMHYGNMEFGAD